MDMATRQGLFLDIIQQGSFAKAADLRNIDRSVISKQIKILEDNLGVRLLNRSTRSLSLTDAGKEILKQAETVRDVLADTQRLAESFHSEPKGLIRITCPVSTGLLYIQKAINIFMNKYPQTYIELMLDDRRSDIIGDKFDIAFRIAEPKDSGLIAKKLAPRSFAILASKEFIEQYGQPQTPEELARLPAVIYANGEFTLNKIEISEAPGSNTMKKYNMSGRYKSNDIDALLDAVQAGLGYSVIVLSALKKNIKEMGLVPLLSNYRLADDAGGLYAMYPHRNQTSLVKLFIETVQELIGTPPVWESYIDDYSAMYK